MILLYIDPGAGSLVIQALIAAAVSVPFFFRRVIRNTWRRVRGLGPEPTEASASDPSPAPESAPDSNPE